MRGAEIQQLRQSLGMSVPQFAQVLGVAHTTVYRWELSGTSDVKIDPMPLGILTQLRERLGRNPPKKNRDLGEDVAKALILGGAVFALYKILEASFSAPTQVRRKGVAGGGRSTATTRRSPTK